MKEKKIALVAKECVACGCCIKSCPLQALSVPYGTRAVVNTNKCVGCGKCAKACPAQVISIVVKEEQNEKEKEMV